MWFFKVGKTHPPPKKKNSDVSLQSHKGTKPVYVDQQLYRYAQKALTGHLRMKLPWLVWKCHIWSSMIHDSHDYQIRWCVPGTLNNHFSCNDLESSSWNNHKETGCLEFQVCIVVSKLAGIWIWQDKLAFALINHHVSQDFYPDRILMPSFPATLPHQIQPATVISDTD